MTVLSRVRISASASRALSSAACLVALGCGAAGSPAADPEPTPRDESPQVRVRTILGDDTAVAVVEVHGDRVDLSNWIGLEYEQDGQLMPLARRGALAWTSDCASKPDCIELVRGAELTAPLWVAPLEDPRCVCACSPLPPGRYRFTVVSCDGQQSVAGEIFEVPEGALRGPHQ